MMLPTKVSQYNSTYLSRFHHVPIYSLICKESLRLATKDVVTEVLKNAAVIDAANDVQSFQDNLETINLLTSNITVDDFPTLEVTL